MLAMRRLFASLRLLGASAATANTAPSAAAASRSAQRFFATRANKPNEDWSDFNTVAKVRNIAAALILERDRYDSFVCTL